MVSLCVSNTPFPLSKKDACTCNRVVFLRSTIFCYKCDSIWFSFLLALRPSSPLSARQKSVKVSWVSVTGYFRLPSDDGFIVIHMRGATNLKKACPSIWCSRPRLATALAETWKGSSWLGNCLSLSLGTGLRSPCGASGAPRRL